MKILLVILSVVVIVVVAGGVFLGPHVVARIGGMRPQAKGTPVKLHEVRQGTLIEAISAPGIVEPKTEVSISARFSARIEELPFEEGDMVEPGDIVVTLDARDLQAMLDQRKAQLRSDEARIKGLRARLVTTRADWRRAKDLLETGDRTPVDVELAEASYLEIESQLEASIEGLAIARAGITQAEDELSYSTLKSPIHGTITRINAEVGETVIAGTMNNVGTVILVIADFSEMVVKARIDESDIAPIEHGQTAKVYINAYPDDVFDGVVQHIALFRSIDNTGGAYFETELLIETNGRRLYSGLTANVDIQVEQHEQILIVPSQSVQERLIDDLPQDIVEASEYVDSTHRYANVVYRMVDGEAQVALVKVGPSDLINTIILGGIEADDIVVSGPFKVLMSIKHEQKIVDEQELRKDEKDTASDANEAEPEQADEATDDAESDEPTNDTIGRAAHEDLPDRQAA
ncbi:MAG: efflux RND transporter periplasmic adaptor subunit [Phycisphaerales bacterium]|nr:efflux RND transporter periplasmic adaptor subunit [Phycisphaerales bacterium]